MLSTFQEDPGSLYAEKLQKESSLRYSGQQSLDLFSEPDGGVCRDDAERRCGDSDGGKAASVNSLSADGESSSLFVSAAGGLEWLMEALKERCLSQACTVQLERLHFLPMTQPCSQSTYSSCLEPSGSESKEDHTAESAIQSDNVPPVGNSDKSASASDCYIVNVLLEPSSRNANWENSESVTCVDDAQNDHQNQSPAGIAAPTRLTNEYAKTAQSKYRNRYEKTRGTVCEHKPAAKTESSTSDEAAAPTPELKEMPPTSRAVVKVKNMSLSELMDFLQPKGGGPKSSTYSSDSERSEDAGSLKTASKSSSSASSDIGAGKSSRSFPKRDKRSLAPKERRLRSPSADRPGTTRKACVSGMSVSRWKNRGAAGATAFRSKKGASAVDCSINELISKQPNVRFTPTQKHLSQVR